MGRGKVLEVEDDPAFQRRDWLAQRIGWTLLAVIGVAALLGVFGQGGPLASTAAMSANGSVHARYERFVRRHSPTRLEFTLAPGLAAPDGLVHLWLDRRYAEGLEISSVQPEPARVSVTPALLIYSFTVADGGSPVTVTFEFEHERAGRSRSQAGVLPQGSVTLDQFVYP